MNIHIVLEIVGYMTAVIAPVLHVLGVFHALHALMHVRTSQGTVAWTISLVSFPLLAIPAYWIFGRSKFRGYRKARQEGVRSISETSSQAVRQLQPFALEEADARNPMQSFGLSIAGLPMTSGNLGKLLVDGDATFYEMLSAIKEARDYVLVEFFVVHGDRIGERLKEILLEKLREGVRVLFLFDELGSKRLPRAYPEELRAAGAEVSPFRTHQGLRYRFQLNFRNHRKIVVIDGRHAFIGGLNVGDEYMGRNPRFGRWRDTHLYVEGPSVQAIQLAFCEDWHWATRRIPEVRWDPVPSPAGNQSMLVLPTGPADELRACQLYLLSLFQSAQSRLWITSPYFVPDAALVAALQLAALRGVDVRIMLPDRPDHLLVYLSAFSYFAEMQQAGVRLYRYEDGFMHQKVILVDDLLASVGTVNLDNRSMFLNFELSVLVHDAEFARQTRAMLEEDFRKCRAVEADELTRRPLHFRMAVRLARLFDPVQ